MTDQKKPEKQDCKQGKEQKQIRKDAFTRIGFIFLIILLIANTIQLTRFGAIVERVDQYNKGVVDELGGFRQDMISFGSDINEMRSFLLLPSRDYSFADKETKISDEDPEESSNTQKAIYQFLGSYTEEMNYEENMALSLERIKALNANESLKENLEKSELAMTPVEENEETCSFKVIVHPSPSSVPLFAVIIDKKTNQLRVQSVLGTKEIEETDAEKSTEELSKYLTENKDNAQKLKDDIETKKTGISNIINNEEVISLLKEKNLSFPTEVKEDANGYSYSVINSEETELITVTIQREDALYKMSENSYSNENELLAAFMEELKNTDGSTAMEKLINERKQELAEVFNDEAFKDMLSTSELSVTTEPREDYNKVLYDVTNKDGIVEFSFVIEMSSGSFKVLKDNEEIDLHSFLQDNTKKKL